MTELKAEFRGGALNLFNCRDHEVVLAGPRDTGKTFAACFKAAAYCFKSPGCQGAIIRKTQKSLAGTVLKTFERVVKGHGVRAYGGASPERYYFQNGSVVWCGGMDNADKVLSSERDFIYVNQAEELALDDWEKLAGSCSGRGAVVAHPQLLGDCNPAGSRHWIRERAKVGKLTLLSSVHRDNPDLFTKEGVVTEQGARRLAVLDSLTGIRRKRLLEGLWATAEGAVYEMFDSTPNGTHVRQRDPDEMKRWFLTVDEGYTNPAVVLVVGADSDGRWHVFREWYRRGQLQSAVVDQTKSWSICPSPGCRCELVAVDEAAAGLIADLQSVGVPARGAKGRVVDGIYAIQNRIELAGDGRPRLTVDPACENTINEFESYVWDSTKLAKDQPVKENDHAMDALRYLAIALGEPTGAWGTDWLPPSGGADRQDQEATDASAYEVELEVM